MRDFSTLHLRFATGEKMLNFRSRPNQTLLSPFLAMLSASSLALIGVVAVPVATETVSAETVISQLGLAIDGEAAGDFSGYSVALSSDGSRVAIGAPYNGSNAGHVRIYDLDGGTWTQVGSDINGEAEGDISGHSVALSSDGSRVAIGAYNNDGTGSNAGHVRIYEYSGGTWNQLGSDIDGEAASDISGHSVALSSDGSRVAIGAPANDGNGSNAGHVRIYDYDGVDGDVDQIDKWTQVGTDINGEAEEDLSGHSVALSSDGSRVAIGAYNNDGNGIGAGHVRIYDLDGGTWTQVGSDIDGEAASDSSGFSVALSSDGSRVAIGAPDNDGNGNLAGHVRIYDLDGGTWTQVGSDIDGEAASDTSGYSVALSSDGSRVAIGAPQNDGNGSDAGHVRLYSIVYQAPAPAPDPVAPAPYSGPLPTNYSDKTPSIGDEVIISGRRMNLVTSLTIDGVTAVMSNQSADSFTIVIPEGITSGLKDLVMTGPAGKLTAQGAVTVQESIPAIIDEVPVSSKVNAGSFNGYVAVYAKGHKGKTLSWKIAGKWFKTTITSDYQVFQRRTAAVGLDVDVHLYIDGQKQLTKTVRTR